MNHANGKPVFLGLLYLSLILRIQVADGIECYTCTNVSSVADCKRISTCSSADSLCHMELTRTATGNLFTLGCTTSSNCPPSATNTTAAIVGRSLMSGPCSSCCSTSNCNRQLCQLKDSTCSNTEQFDCSFIGSTINYCADQHRAKIYCKYFCGLCSLRDGGWSDWNSWSNCDATCGTGTQTRIRNCDNPAPVDGGDNCVSSSSEVRKCVTKVCPVHGGWTPWSPWGSCSSSCDIGLQRRDRTCSNPYPSADGDFCYGDSRSDRVCIMPACADGEWSTWSQWGSCTKTCGEGVRTRSRTCDNPRPSIVGTYCDGDSVNIDTCNMKRCTDGIAFMAYRTLNATLAQNALIIYNTVKLNIGSNFNSATGIFTSPVNGTYSFSIYACSKDNSKLTLQLLVNGNVVGRFIAEDNKWRDCVSRSFIISLITGDKVFVKFEGQDNFVYTMIDNGYPSFSGFLLPSN